MMRVLDTYSKHINITLTSILVILLVVLIPVSIKTAKDNKSSSSDIGSGSTVFGPREDGPTFAPIAEAQECPAVATADARAVTASLGGEPGQKVWMKRSDKLCTLWQVHPDQTKIVPVARSYNGYDWEASAASGDFGNVAIDCVEQACGIVLPEFLGQGYYFELAAFDHVLPKRDEIARFLEQTSFGPTRAVLDAFTGTFAQWVKDQQNNVPLTSHRQYFRERLNGRTDYVSNMSVTTNPCKAGTRYRKDAFTHKHVNPPLRTLIRVKTDDWGRRVFSRIEDSSQDGTAHRLTVLDAAITIGQAKNGPVLSDGVYKICDLGDLEDKVAFRFQTSRGCMALFADGERMEVPDVYFDDQTPPSNPPVNLDGHVREIPSSNGGPVRELYLEKDLDDKNCQLVPVQQGTEMYPVAGIYKGEYWLHDPRFQLEENTWEEPIMDGGASLVRQTRNVQCMNANVNWINAEHCRLSNESDACSPRDPPMVSLQLNVETFQTIYDASGRYVFAVQGLRQNDSPNSPPPCQSGATSRWMQLGTCPQTIQASTSAVFADLLDKSRDTNPDVRDITFPILGTECHPSDVNTFGMGVRVGNQCWVNVHPAEHSVFDFTDFLAEHQGGAEKLQQFAISGTFMVDFPSSHNMQRFYDTMESYLVEVGKLGDVINFPDLPSSLLREDIAEQFKASNLLQSLGATVVCGGAFETKTNPTNYGNVRLGAFDAFTDQGRSSSESMLYDQRKMIWAEIALSCQDVLRQRVAWALSQILCISPGFISDGDLTEQYVTYYDIFVRHAFGNYRDILREVSYSPMMGEMLSFLDNKSTDLLFRTRNRIEFPDENYAREIMQLFTIGLTKLNNDGTPVRDENGVPVQTYTNSEITEYAKVWTGFRLQAPRGNIETKVGRNRVDQMNMNGEWRDMMPKLGLDGKYVGDGVPLCSDLPDNHFLKKGATYILLGSLPSPRYHSDPPEWAGDDAVKRLSLPNDSALFRKLCNAAASGGGCRYEAKIVLEEDYPCSDIECKVDGPRVLEVGDGIYYEYLRLPCSYQTFFANGKSLRSRFDVYTCGDPRTETGVVGCCSSQSDKFWDNFSLFDGERVTYKKALSRCTERGLDLCFKPQYQCSEGCDRQIDFWSTAPCSLSVKLGVDGTVALVHEVTPDLQTNKENVINWVGEDTKTFFRVPWLAGSSPSGRLSDYDEMCESLGCTRDEFDNLCLCRAEVEENIGFESPPTAEQVLKELHYGTFSPYDYWGDHDILDLGNGVKLHSIGKNAYQKDSVFEVLDENGLARFRKNLRSTVHLGSNDRYRLSFRNPTHMMATNDVEERDAHYEIETSLDHYFYHPNTAPFVAIRFAQRFGISNPSPRYVDTVATAFRKGLYVDPDTGTVFGAGSYGDLAATVAAIVLDREARSVILEADPAFGSLLEPLLRVFRVMKSLEFEHGNRSLFLHNLIGRIGEEPHELPRVFSFFLPEYEPPGPVGDAGLLCPECEVMSGPTITHLLNGALSMIRFGLTHFAGGFGNEKIHLFAPREVGNTDFSEGALTYSPDPSLDSRGIVDELATLLTSGRLSREKRDLIVSVYEQSTSIGLVRAQELVTTAPEFHTNGLARTTQARRPPREVPPANNQPYKAVINILLNGGCDSFNVLAPHVCNGKNSEGETVVQQYRRLRGEIALQPSEIDFTVAADSQPCSSFALHPETPILKQLYDEGSLAFLANVGVIDTAEMTRDNYEEVSVSTFFGHNTMQKESQLLDPYREARGTGILGRLSEVLTSKGFKASGVAIDKPSFATNIDTNGNAPDPLVMGHTGPVEFYPGIPNIQDFNLLEHASSLNAQTDLYSSLFGESFSEEFLTGVDVGEQLVKLWEETSIGSQWGGRSKLKGPLEAVARLVQTHDKRGVNRDMFYIDYGFWDHHARQRLNLSLWLKDLNDALTALQEEMKDQGLWDNVAVLVTSDFGRTLTPNGQEGSDHAWGGNYFLLGGNVNGGQVLGKYPEDLTENGPLGVGRGRIMPTTSWDAVWNGICEWMGVETEEEMLKILPNLPNTHGGQFTPPIKASELFRV